MAALTSAQAQTQLIVLSENDELYFMADAAAPGTIIGPIPITGLSLGQDVIGLDFRPATGEMYILAYTPLIGQAQLYTVLANGTATAVGSPALLSLGGGSVGFDFNPVVDRIRVVSANGSNYRLNPNDGAVTTDGTLQYAPTDPNASAMPSIGAAAYTNSYIGTQSTALYDYDETLNILVTQNPPNAGTLNTVGSSGIVVNSADRTADMDIFTDPTTLASTAYFVANTTGNANDNLYTINLATGAATLVGAVGTGLAVKDIAAIIDRTLPAVTGQITYGITRGTQNLISFDNDNPQFIRSLTAITGVTAGQRIVGMDMRPATLTLHAMGYDTLASTYQIYTINPTTAVATPVNATPLSFATPLGAGSIGFDFNPTVDRIRVVSSTNGSSYRLNPNDGAITAVDTAVAYATGDPNNGRTPRVGSVAYTNSFKTATTTTLFGIDDTLGALVRIAPPNGGVLNTISSSVFLPNVADMTSDIDIYYDSVTSTNMAYLSANTGSGTNDVLYMLNTTNGLATSVGNIGMGLGITDIAVTLDYNGTLGIKERYLNNAAIGVYPNPVKDMLYINTAESGLRYTVTSMTGSTLTTGTVSAKAINVSNLPAGVYLMRLTTADGAAYGTARFVKQ